MAFDTVQRDISLAIADILDERFVFAQAGAHLVEIGNMEVAAQADFT